VIRADHGRRREHPAGTAGHHRGFPQGPAPAVAVGTVYALHAIAEGATLAHALDKLGTDDSDTLGAVKAHYRSVIATMTARSYVVDGSR